VLRNKRYWYNKKSNKVKQTMLQMKE